MFVNNVWLLQILNHNVTRYYNQSAQTYFNSESYAPDRKSTWWKKYEKFIKLLALKNYLNLESININKNKR